MGSHGTQAAGKTKTSTGGRAMQAFMTHKTKSVSYQVLKGERNLSSERDLPGLSPGQHPCYGARPLNQTANVKQAAE